MFFWLFGESVQMYGCFEGFPLNSALFGLVKILTPARRFECFGPYNLPQKLGFACSMLLEKV